MARLIIFILIFISFSIKAQTYLGNTSDEISILAKEDFTNITTSFEKVNDELSFITIQNEYETLYFYLLNDVCVKFVVSKPYSCNCLSTDIMAYNSQLKSIGKMKWVNKDYTKNYEMTLHKKDYHVSITNYNDDASEGISFNIDR